MCFTHWFRRTLDCTPWSRMSCFTYARISALPEYVRDQSGLGANENEYRLDGMSQAAPGYWLSRQVPPTSAARSRITKSDKPACCSRMAAPKPPKPAPMMSVSVFTRRASR